MRSIWKIKISKGGSWIEVNVREYLHPVMYGIALQSDAMSVRIAALSYVVEFRQALGQALKTRDICAKRKRCPI
jgi:hypothetical protein